MGNIECYTAFVETLCLDEKGVYMKSFLDFVRSPGVVGLAVGIILGGAVTKLVAALITDLVNPVIGLMLGMAGDLAALTLKIGPIEIMYGHFLSVLLDFVVVAGVVFFGVKALKLEKLDKKK